MKESIPVLFECQWTGNVHVARDPRTQGQQGSISALFSCISSSLGNAASILRLAPKAMSRTPECEGEKRDDDRCESRDSCFVLTGPLTATGGNYSGVEDERVRRFWRVFLKLTGGFFVPVFVYAFLERKLRPDDIERP